MEQKLFAFIEKYIRISEVEKKAILSMEVFKTYKKGTILLKEGQYSDESYFVLDGCIRTYYLIDGEEKTTAFYTELESCNPFCTINQKASEYFIDCLEDVILVVSNPHLEKQLFAEFPRFESV